MPAAAVVAGGALSAFGNISGAYGAEKSADESSKRQMEMNREGIAENKRQFDVKKGVYDEAIGRGKGYYDTANTGFMEAANTENPELEQAKADLLSGNAEALQEGSGQMSADLAAQGVRGGQAANLLRRGTGAMAIQSQRDLNSMGYDDAAKREADKRAYLAAIAQRGQAGAIGGASL